MGMSRQEYWRELPCPSPGDLPDPGMERSSPASSALAGSFFTSEDQGCPPKWRLPISVRGRAVSCPEPRSQVEGPLWKEVHPEGCFPRAHLGQGPQVPQPQISCGPVGTGLRFPRPQAALASSSKVPPTGAWGRQWRGREQGRPVVARKPWRAGEGALK